MNREKASKENGYLMNLYRNPEQGWLFGVCAGLGDHFDKPYWMVRLAALTLFLFTGELAILLYIAGIFLLAKNPVKAGSRWRGRHRRHACRANREARGGREYRECQRSDHRNHGDRRDHRQASTADPDRPSDRDDGAVYGRHETLFTYRPTPSRRLKAARARLEKLDKRLQSMERYVTSSKYRFNQEINNL